MNTEIQQVNQDKYLHLLIKSNLHNPLFLNISDYQVYKKFLAHKLSQYNIRLIGYGLFSGCIHLVFEGSNPINLSAFLHGVNLFYVKYYHKKYQTEGRLFSVGYKHEVIEGGKELIKLMRFIHQKPVKQQMCTGLKNDYTSYLDYTTPNSKSFVWRRSIYTLFNHKDPVIASNLFACIHHELEEDITLDLNKNIYAEVSVAKKILREELAPYGNDCNQVDQNYELRKNLVTKIYNASNLSQQEIADFLGISRHVVGRVIRLNKAI